MGQILVRSSADPQRLRTLAMDGIAAGAYTGIVVARRLLERDLRATLQRSGDQWGPPVLTLADALALYEPLTRDLPPLDPIALRPLVEAAALEVATTDAGAWFRSRLSPDGALRETTAAALVRFLLEACPQQISTAAMTDALCGTSQKPTEDHQGRRLALAAWYEAVAARCRRTPLSPALTDALEAAGRSTYDGPLLPRQAAAMLAACQPVPAALVRPLFLGFDGSSPTDPAVQLAYALGRNPNVDEVTLALLSDQDPDRVRYATAEATGWVMDGNEPLFKFLHDVTDARQNVPVVHLHAPDPDPSTVAPGLGAFTAAPLRFRAPAVDAAGSVSVHFTPDSRTQLQWVFRDLKRRLQDDPTLRVEDFALIARNAGVLAPEVIATAESFGVPLVASYQRALPSLPAVQALLQLLRLQLTDWTPDAVQAIAGNPYLRTPWTRRMAQELVRSGSAGGSAEAWANTAISARIGPPELGEQVLRLGRRLATSCPTAPATAEAWRLRVAAVALEWDLEAQAHALVRHLPRAQRAGVAKADLDGLNTVLQLLERWVAGAQTAYGPDHLWAPAQLWGAWSNLLEGATQRCSTYPTSGLALLDPLQAAYQRYAHVYLLDVVDGVWPGTATQDILTITPGDRDALGLPTVEAFRTRERVLWRLAVGTATHSLAIGVPGQTTQGLPLPPSPFVSALRFRLTAVEEASHSAYQLLPRTAAEILRPSDVALVAAEDCRGGDGRVFGAWAQGPQAPGVIQRWAQAAARQSFLRTGVAPADATMLGAVGRPASPRAPVFNVRDLAEFQRCGWRYLATRVWGVTAERQRGDESALFGQIEHSVLARVLPDLYRRRLVEPGGDPQRALAHAEAQAAPVIQQQLQHARPDLPPAILARETRFLVGRILGAVAAEISDQTGRTFGGTLPLTTLVDTDVTLGDRAAPIPVDLQGRIVGLYGRVDRIERITDPRLTGPAAAAAQSSLEVWDVRTSATAKTTTGSKFVRGESFVLPLLTHLAELRFDAPASAFGELMVAQTDDLGAPIRGAVRNVSYEGTGARITATPAKPPRTPKHKLDIAPGTAVTYALAQAREVAATLITQMEAGDFVPSAERSCHGCPLSHACHMAGYTGGDAGARATRAMPI